MAIYKLPHYDQLTDAQFFTVQGPDGLFSGFQYNDQTRTVYIKDAQVIYPSFHGITHISEDPVPNATMDLPGLMSADDKAKLESLVQMKIGVLGFQGAGYPDDGGWLEGPVIFAAGSELISIERMGNVVRFTVDSPVPLNCNLEECAQIYWIQDESDVQAIRTPSCAGRLPGVNGYGELKFYLFPESTILDQTNPLNTLNQKDKYPALIFKRYENNINYSGQFEVVLRRNNNLTTNVGHSQTPGGQGGLLAETIWFTGQDSDGRTIRFDFKPESDPGMLGAILYQGHTLTRRMGIITGRDPTVGSTNKYKIKYWDVANQQTIGDEFVATNVWRYQNYSTTPSLVLDKSIRLLEIGYLVKLWEFNIQNTSLVRRYFSDEPRLDPQIIWTHTDSITFGDTLEARIETDNPPAAGDEQLVTDIRTYEKANWGIVTFPDPLYYVAASPTGGVSDLNGPYNSMFSANIDYDLPGLHVVENEDVTGDMTDTYERPVYLWHRANHANFYTRMYVGQPDSSFYPPIDLLFRSKIDSFDDVYVDIRETGVIGDDNYIIVRGVEWGDIPKRGTVRFLTKSRNLVWKYEKKAMTDSLAGNIMLIGESPLPATTEGIDPAPGEMSIGLILHEDYDTYCCRLEFLVNDEPGTEGVQLQFKVGILDMNEEYQFNETSQRDNLIKGFMPGSYSVSRWFYQDGFWSGPGTTTGDPSNFIVFPGGRVLGEEAWNKLEILCRDGEFWIWWNEMLVTPDASENANVLPAPEIDISNPYFDISGDPDKGIPGAPTSGKFGMRLWPGAKIRSLSLRDQAFGFNPLAHGQLEIYD